LGEVQFQGVTAFPVHAGEFNSEQDGSLQIEAAEPGFDFHVLDLQKHFLKS
jgi:hypothetical protein